MDPETEDRLAGFHPLLGQVHHEEGISFLTGDLRWQQGICRYWRKDDVTGRSRQRIFLLSFLRPGEILVLLRVAVGWKCDEVALGYRVAEQVDGPGPEDDLLGERVGEYDSTQASVRPANAFQDHAQGADTLADAAQVFGQSYIQEPEFMGLGQDRIVKGSEWIAVARFPAVCQFLASEAQGKILEGLCIVIHQRNHHVPTPFHCSNSRA